MDAQEQTFHFADDLDKLVDRYREEYDMTYAAVVGALQMKIYCLCDEASKRSEEAGEP